ncbi:MAG: DUF6273 domain-containing protein [Oscillospiraceae bacterium]|jgi:hypothetical protein|nr:DUF6273 domain-containing protein [Oscillospiraceae bacterium]
MKKAIILALALVLVIGTMAGCGKTGDNSGNSTTPGTSQGGTSSTTTPDSTSKPAGSGLVGKAGDTASYGTYNGKPVEWQALAVDLTAKKALLITKDCITDNLYNEGDDVDNTTWETATIREWLNGEFYSAAFTDAQKAKILESDIAPQSNPENGISGGNATKDKVFILSEAEVRQYFSSDEARTAKYDGTGAAWRTRTPGITGSSVCFVYPDGTINTDGFPVNRNHEGDIFAVRPAIWVDITPETESSPAQENTAPSNGDGTSTDWPDNEFTRLVPKPEIGTLAGTTGGEDRFLATITNVPEADGLNYIAACQNMGWSGDVTGYEGMRGFESVKDGYSLNIAVRGGGMTIQIIRQ